MPPSVALVLSAGGAIGSAYHAGALAALADVGEWDARTAELIVGTSAGSSAATLLRIGFSPADLRRRARGERLSDEGEALLARAPEERLELPSRPGVTSFLVPEAPWLLAPAFLSRGPVRPGLLLAGFAPRGAYDLSQLGDRMRALSPDDWEQGWPDRPTWICAVRLRDGRRTVFGRDPVDVPDIGTAVQASSAVPALFRPVDIGPHTYVDGACWSSTNADLVAALGFDLVVIVSTMSAVPRALDRSMHQAARTVQARLLAREVARIRDKGSETLVIQPTVADLATMGINPMEDGRASEVTRSAYESVGELLDRPEVASRLRTLRATKAT
jgi:NTE family protein